MRTTQAIGTVSLLLAALALTGCSASSATLEEEPAAPDDNAAVATEEAPAPDGPPCELVDASDIYTPAFAEFANGPRGYTYDETRCKIPEDATIIQLFRQNGLQIDGISPGTEDDEVGAFYLAFGDGCIVEVAYFLGEGNYSPYKTDYPEKLRFATAAEAFEVANDCG